MHIVYEPLHTHKMGQHSGEKIVSVFTTPSFIDRGFLLLYSFCKGIKDEN